MARCLQAVRGSADKGTDDCERAVRDPKLGALRRDVGKPRRPHEEVAVAPGLSAEQTFEPAKLGKHGVFRAPGFWKPSPRKCGMSLTIKRLGNQ